MKYYYYILALVLLAACKKHRDMPDDGAGSETISGRVVLQDTITQKPLRYLAGVVVKLSRDSVDENNFMFSTTTDAEGNFSFGNLGKERYFLFAEVKDSNIVYYHKMPADLSLADGGKVSLTLWPKKAGQNGIVYIVQASNGQPASAVKACFFSNWQAAIGDTCEGSAFTINSNALGKAIALNVTPSRYIVHFNMSAGGVVYTARDTVNVVKDSIQYRYITLAPKTAIRPNGIIYTLTDVSGAPLKGATVCFFNSAVLANDSCNGYTYQETSDIKGNVAIRDIPAGKYISFMKVTAGSVILKASDTVQVSATQLVEKPIKLQ